MRRRQHDGIDAAIAEHRIERADRCETVLRGEIPHPRRIAAYGMGKTQLVALPLHRIHQVLAPATEPDDCRCDHPRPFGSAHMSHLAIRPVSRTQYRPISNTTA